jgi:hypothetical protein
MIRTVWISSSRSRIVSFTRGLLSILRDAEVDRPGKSRISHHQKEKTSDGVLSSSFDIVHFTTLAAVPVCDLCVCLCISVYRGSIEMTVNGPDQ